MKTLKFLLVGAIALGAFAACSDDEEVLGEDYYASQASITCSDSHYTSTGDGGAISFTAEGGSVVINVSCEVDWTVQDNSTLILADYSVSAGTITVTADQNTEEEERSATIKVCTAQSLIQFATITVTQNAYGKPEIKVAADKWNAPAVGALTTEIGVEATDSWMASSSADWLTVDRGDDSVVLTVTENETYDKRSAEVELTCTDGIQSSTAKISVTQDGLVYLTISEDIVVLYADGGSADITVDTNFDWDASFDASASWLSVSGEGASMTVTAAENTTGDSREAVVTVTAGDGAENVAEAQFTVTQSGFSKDDFVLEYTTTSSNNTIALPLDTVTDYTLSYTVDWGDGSSVESKTSTFPTHTYSSAGTYLVRVNGSVPAINNASELAGVVNYLTAVRQWGSIAPVQMSRAFYNCTNLKSFPEDAADFSQVTTFQYAFAGCSGLTTVPAKLLADCPVATTMAYIFQNCTGLETLPSGLIGSYPELTNLSYMFYGCTSLKTIPSDLFVGSRPKSNNHSYLFYECSSLEAIPEGLFETCTTSTSFSYAFYYCEKITSVPANLFANCTSLANLSFTFQGTGLESIPSGLFDDCTAVTNVSSLFRTCPIKEIPKGLFDNLYSVTAASNIFHQCTALESIPDGLFDAFTENDKFDFAFQHCDSLKSIPEGLFANCKKVRYFSQCFAYCGNLTGESEYDLVNIDGETVKVHLYERENHTDIYTKPTSTTQCYTSSTGLSDYYSIPSSWGGGK